MQAIDCKELVTVQYFGNRERLGLVSQESIDCSFGNSSANISHIILTRF